MLQVQVPENSKKRKQQIAALEWQLKHDTNEKDRQIHREAIRKLKEG